jgi:hypothetical protein
MAQGFATMIGLISRFFNRWTMQFGFDLFYPPLWGVLSLACLAGTLIAYPLHLWLIRRGIICWESEPRGEGILTAPG